MNDGPTNKTRLATNSELSYDKLLNYLEWMTSKNLVREDDGRVGVLENGIGTYNQLVDWILKYVGKLKFSR
ncbi:MAG: winged helix-turn-helix domain-containing protein [Candidatus Thermoplasmatota archaeon]|jgi:predicted transcriptional regulator|nr:winged helix-turn-helix domain-containing protein [Candidatus Thermoplasmatota archaeon]